MERDESPTTRGRVLMAGILMVFTVGLMVAFYTTNENPALNDSDVISQENLFGDERGQNVSLEEVTGDPNAFVGQVISVRGQVQKNIGTRGLTVETTGVEPGELLVISRESLVGVGGGPGEGKYQESEGVRISGVVRSFTHEELEAEIGAELNEDAYREYSGKPVIIADSIDPLQN